MVCDKLFISAMVLIFSTCSAQGTLTTGFTNPLNSKRLDLFFIVDEANQYMSSTQLEWLKRAIYEISLNLNPSGSSPYFGVYFYGATSSVDVRVSFPTGSAAALKTSLNPKSYVIGQTYPSTLASAASFVNSHCSSWCRSDTPRFTLIFTSNPDRSANSTIRLLERNYGMIVMIVPIGTYLPNILLNAHQLASYPQTRYVFSVADALHVPLFSDHISSIIADVPRVLYNKNSLPISYMSSYTYYTFQINTASYTPNDEATVILASTCSSCTVFVSLTEQIPASGKATASAVNPFYTANGQVNYVSYIRVPRGTARVFVSYYSLSGLYNVVIISDVIWLPAPLTMPIARIAVDDAKSVLG